MAKRKTILYFIRGHAPNDTEREVGTELGASFRNVNAHLPGDRLEEADEVYGAWPAGYEKMPNCKVNGEGLAGLLKAEAKGTDADADKKAAGKK